jgi:hypothetical protein
MRMICDRVICKGGDREGRKNYGKKESRLILFPDGVRRIIVLGLNDWSIIDKNNKIEIPSSFAKLQHILDHAESCAAKYSWPKERAIQYLFRLGHLGWARVYEYGGKHPTNDDDWADTLVRAQLPNNKIINLTRVFMSSAKSDPVLN